MEGGNDLGQCTEWGIESDDEREHDFVLGESELGDRESGIPTYTCTPGCSQPPSDGSPLHFFRMLVTDNIVDHAVTQTRLYASQFIHTHTIGPRSRVQQWERQEFNRDELIRFISLIVIMGLVNLPKVEDHWVTSWPYSSQTCSKVSSEDIV